MFGGGATFTVYASVSRKKRKPVTMRSQTLLILVVVRMPKTSNSPMRREFPTKS